MLRAVISEQQPVGIARCAVSVVPFDVEVVSFTLGKQADHGAQPLAFQLTVARPETMDPGDHRIETGAYPDAETPARLLDLFHERCAVVATVRQEELATQITRVRHVMALALGIGCQGQAGEVVVQQ